MTTSRRMIGIATSAACLAIVSTSAQAQGTASRWQPFYGCWTPSMSSGAVSLDPKLGAIVCVEQTDNPDVAELATIVNGKVATHDSVDASGASHALASKECAGSQSARFSADERRVYLTSTMRCGSQASTSTSLLAIAPNGDWLDVRGTRAGEGTSVRVARYRSVDMKTFRDELPASMSDKLMAAHAARVAAGAPVSIKSVIDATASVDTAVVTAWIMERGQQFDINAKTLVTLADAGVSSSVTDALVAVSNPGAFQFARAEMGTDEPITGRRTTVIMDPWRWGQAGYGAGYGYGYGYDSGYGYGYSPYGYNSYGYNRYGYGIGYYPPVIIVNNSNNGTPGQITTSPRAVNGRGYTQNGSGASQSSGQSSSGSGSSSSSGTSTTTTTQTTQTETRTAKPKP